MGLCLPSRICGALSARELDPFTDVTVVMGGSLGMELRNRLP